VNFQAGMQQPGILQPAEADSQSIGRRRFTELPGRLNFRDRIGRIPNRSQIGIRDLIRSAPGFNKIPPYAVRTRDLSIYYVYGGRVKFAISFVICDSSSFAMVVSWTMADMSPRRRAAALSSRAGSRRSDIRSCIALISCSIR
jgi:hypothetical protein